MTGSDNEMKQRERVIAENESKQQTTGDIRVSVWAICVAAVIAVAIFGWLLAR